MSIEPNYSGVKLSHKLEYACRVLAQLALDYGQSKLAHIDTLSEAEQIPANYLVQILNELRNAGLITSKRGKQGGYALAHPPSAINLADIVRAIDPELLESKLDSNGQSGKRVSHVWSEVGSVVEGKIKSYTLEDLMPSDSGEMYYI